MEKVKMQWDDIGEQWLVMAGGNPFKQVYQSLSWTNALQILEAYVYVGYKDVTNYDEMNEIIESRA